MNKSSEFLECANCTCFAARRGARAITQLYDRYLRPAGLKATQFTLLAFLVQSDSLPLSQVADRLGMERTTLTRNLQPLILKGYVEVTTGKDQRVRMIEITDQGVAAAKRALPYWTEAQQKITDQLAPATLLAVAELARVSA